MSTEEAIQAAGADVAPRITPADIEAEITREHYFTALDGAEVAAQRECRQQRPDIVLWSPSMEGFQVCGSLRRVTLCVLELKNGTKIVGVNYGAIDPAKHNADVGRERAREHAIEQVWALLGFRLRDRLHEPEAAFLEGFTAHPHDGSPDGLTAEKMLDITLKTLAGAPPLNKPRSGMADLSHEIATATARAWSSSAVGHFHKDEAAKFGASVAEAARAAFNGCAA